MPIMLLRTEAEWGSRKEDKEQFGDITIIQALWTAIFDSLRDTNITVKKNQRRPFSMNPTEMFFELESTF